jgi:prespore-specific regulator
MEGLTMKKNRQDAWTPDEDLLLAEVVLRHIREGSTQLNAFEEVGELVSRTSAACGFRWNSLVRKKYETAINLAKKHRKQGSPEQEVATKQDEYVEESNLKPTNKVEKSNNSVKQTLSIDDMVDFLQSVKEIQAKQQSLEEENKKLTKQVNELDNEKNQVQKKFDELQREYQLMNEDYKALIGIMERARKMVIMQDELDSKLKFQMDYNGNLEKVNKK